MIKLSWGPETFTVYVDPETFTEDGTTYEPYVVLHDGTDFAFRGTVEKDEVMLDDFAFADSLADLYQRATGNRPDVLEPFEVMTYRS